MPAIVYPSTLPYPALWDGVDRERRVPSSLPGNTQIRGRAEDRLNDVDAVWEYTSDHMTTWRAWYESTLLNGQLWFAMAVPGDNGYTSKVLKFRTKSLKETYLGNGVYRVSAQLQQRGRSAAPLELVPTDPNFANVVLLLHLDNGNTSSTFIDSSVNNFPRHTASDGGNPPRQSTGQVKFGTSSYILSTTQTLRYDDNVLLNIGTSDFTYEAWIYANSNPTNVFLIAKGNLTPRWALGTRLGNLAWWENGNPSLTGTAVATGTWLHVAATRAGGTLRLFIGGALVATGANSVDYTNTDTLAIGSSESGSEQHDGYMDDVRITKGVARYTAAFTAPTAPFPNSSE